MKRIILLFVAVFTVFSISSAETKEDFYRRNAKEKIKQLKKEGWEYSSKDQMLEDKLIVFYINNNDNSYIDFTGFSDSNCTDIVECTNDAYFNAIFDKIDFAVIYIEQHLKFAIKDGKFESEDASINSFLNLYKRNLLKNLLKKESAKITLQRKTNNGIEIKLFCQMKESDLNDATIKALDYAALICFETINQKKILNFINSELRNNLKL